GPNNQFDKGRCPVEAWMDCKQCRAAMPVGATRCLKCGMKYPKGAGAGIGKSLLIRLAYAVFWLVYFKIVFSALEMNVAILVTLVTLVLAAGYVAYQRRTE
ncbi:MAG: hypothetical protein JWN40_1305, partial [Phycisphaerales bacterium]|nr:hypothetical protein [Phycisphaerales bacterium]